MLLARQATRTFTLAASLHAVAVAAWICVREVRGGRYTQQAVVGWNSLQATMHGCMRLLCLCHSCGVVGDGAGMYTCQP
jgi:hypothetical protein